MLKRRDRTVAFMLVLAANFAAGLGPAAAQDAMGMQTGDLKISTSSTDYNINSGDFSMPHHVSATRPGTQIDGDRATGNGKRRTVTIDGHVFVRQDGGASSKGGGLFANLGSSGGGKSQEPSTLTTRKLTVELGTKTYTADGDVHYVQGLRTVTADHGVLNDLSHNLHLTGHVHIDDAGHVLEADTVDYNTMTEDVQAHDNVQITVPVEQGIAPPGQVAHPPAHPHHRLLR